MGEFVICRYYTDPSGTFWQCNGKAIGSGSEGADSSLQEQYNKVYLLGLPWRLHMYMTKFWSRIFSRASWNYVEFFFKQRKLRCSSFFFCYYKAKIRKWLGSLDCRPYTKMLVLHNRLQCGIVLHKDILYTIEILGNHFFIS